jgi:hypothetical protein
VVGWLLGSLDDDTHFVMSCRQIEKDLPSMGGADVFIAMISIVTAAETQNSECVRFASRKLSDGNDMTLVLMRYCTGKCTPRPLCIQVLAITWALIINIA